MRLFALQSLRGMRSAQSRLPRRHGLICPSCQTNRIPQTRWNSTETPASQKPYYVTTPIFYVNAAPHIGHLYTMVLSDVLKRWQQLNGKEAYLSTGTDEHGMKIQQAAAREGMPPKEFCDYNSKKFRDLAEAGTISNDFFIRTTDKDHKEAVEQFWLHLKNALPEHSGLYKGKHAGWYCVSDECFYAEDEVQPSVVPQTGRKIMASIESGNEVEWVEEETWMFPLTKYRDQLLRFYDENPDFIKPASKMNEVRAWVENHLEDLSVTRPTSRLSWGIQDPEDGSNTIYVWVDALINYATKAGYGSKWQIGSKDTGIWPPEVHVVGKDIIRFHAVYWPALLMAVGLPLPKKILCHTHWTMSNRKMSKSLGNVVNPFLAIQRWEVDPLRYFLMRSTNFRGDMGYSNESIMAAYEKDLRANIGNLFSRVARAKGKKWTIEEAVGCAAKGSFNEIAQVAEKHEANPFMNLDAALQTTPGLFKAAMDDINPAAATRELFELLSATNKFISSTEPWNLFKKQDAESRLLLNWVIFSAAEALRISGILLQPIMPEKSAQLLDGLRVHPDRRTFEWAQKGKDLEYGSNIPENRQKPGKAMWTSLFPPLPGDAVPDEGLASPASGEPNGEVTK